MPGNRQTQSIFRIESNRFLSHLARPGFVCFWIFRAFFADYKNETPGAIRVSLRIRWIKLDRALQRFTRQTKAFVGKEEELRDRFQNAVVGVET